MNRREIVINPVAFVSNSRREPVDDNWSSIESEIELVDGMPDDCFDGIEQFS